MYTWVYTPVFARVICLAMEVRASRGFAFVPPGISRCQTYYRTLSLPWLLHIFKLVLSLSSQSLLVGVVVAYFIELHSLLCNRRAQWLHIKVSS